MAKSDNDILKRTLKHYIDLEYYANGVDEEIQELLEFLRRSVHELQEKFTEK